MQGEFPDGSKFFCDHTSHHPPISNFLLEDRDLMYKLYGYYEITGKMGANNFVVTSDKAELKKLANTFDIIINTVSAEIEIHRYIGTLRQWGSLVVVGAPGKPYSIDGSILMGRQLSLSGSNIGSIKETQEMLDFCGKHNITSDVEIIPASAINEAYERVLASDVRYRFVIDTATI
jgi:uncharacterized zinc-type alcohol dehydrogenase-like protein